MTVQAIVYIVLCALSLIAAYAVGAPIQKPEREQKELAEEKDSARHSL